MSAGPARATAASIDSPPPRNRKPPTGGPEGRSWSGARDEEYTDKGSELADARGDPMPVVAHADREQLGRQDERCRVGTELDEEVAEPEDNEEGATAVVSGGDDAEARKHPAITEKPISWRRRCPMRSIFVNANR